MSRKLIPLTDEIMDSESISKLKCWEHDEISHVSMPSGEISNEWKKKSNKCEKILSLISQWSSSVEENEGTSKKFEVFSTKKVAPEPKVSAVYTKYD